MVQAPLTFGNVWQQTIDFYSYPEIAFLFPVEFEFEVVGGELLDVPAGSYFAYEVEMRVLSARSLPVSAVGLDLGTRSGDVLDRDWGSEDVGEVQYGLLDLYQLVSFNGPTPVVSLNWGEAKVRFRASGSGDQRPRR